MLAWSRSMSPTNQACSSILVLTYSWPGPLTGSSSTRERVEFRPAREEEEVGLGSSMEAGRGGREGGTVLVSEMECVEFCFLFFLNSLDIIVIQIEMLSWKLNCAKCFDIILVSIKHYQITKSKHSALYLLMTQSDHLLTYKTR